MNPRTQAVIKQFLQLLLAEPPILTSEELQSLKALFQEIAVLSVNDIDNAVTKIQQWNDNHGDIWAKFDGLRDITTPAPDEKEATQFPNFNITAPAPDKAAEIQPLNSAESTPKPIITYLKEALEKIIKTLEYE
ncbi:hypothetical protein NG798_14085 [Ancylothrix sp. C2]|uniref:hypothetical protein n=1 Tax=Ancylothrix sp. D3o TaxID=2953691 RepID=UPI0021BADF7F|nr:hypothetical protein [Ancylothrix sp. D3o]MCT7950925.1 hypothetical protein [Ancylothrix sp. D3o]